MANVALDIMSRDDAKKQESSEILKTASRQFGRSFSSETVKEDRFDHLETTEHFPKKLEKKDEYIKDLVRLLYLTTFDKNKKSPFAVEDVAIFRTSWERTKITVGWFKKVLVPFTFLSGLSYLSFAAVSGDLSDTEKAAIAGTAGFVSTCALNLLGLCVTGTHPNASKDADNLKQNTIQKVKGSYDEMAKELILLYMREPRFAKMLADKIDLKCISQAAKNCYLDSMEEKTIFKQLKDAVSFVQGKRAYLRHHELRLYSKSIV